VGGRRLRRNPVDLTLLASPAHIRTKQEHKGFMGDVGLAALRGLVCDPRLGDGQVRVPLGHGGADELLGGGLPKGALHEVFAHESSHSGAATGFALGLALRLGGRRPLLWVRQDFSALEFGELHGAGLHELGLDPDSVILLRAVDAGLVLRAAAEGLTCAALGAVIAEIPAEPKILDLVASRRLAFAAGQKNVTAILVRLAAEPDASAAETRWVVRAARSLNDDGDGMPVFAAELTRNRHGRTGAWVMEWNSDDRIFREPDQAAHSGGVAATPANRSIATARIRHAG
jgi:protein ImuA